MLDLLAQRGDTPAGAWGARASRLRATPRHGIGVCVRPGGFIDRWLQFCEPFEFPDSFAIFSLLACASAAIDRRIRVNPGNEPSPYPALYVVLYGPSGVKKGGAIKYATWLFSKAV